ncbi:type II toxin-antitoxin system VapC family toxin [Halomarina halobia]|uniref:Type II toxin-antitoxin system VapC family toxin n=1 Tax=Halomarina halobia TaxID=3033386 RepID=A0ABD6AGA5_9EURY|nr:PIN domain-containing protein [Halomarina sp. PSR21]
MTRTVVDTSALIALLSPDDEHNRAAATLLREAAEEGALLVNPVVYAELAADPFFGSRSDLDDFLDDTGIAVEELPRAAQFEAGKAFQRYLDRRGEELQCSECGHETTFQCPDCDASITARQHVAADFLIGAHAATVDALLTFDRGFYRDYFDVTCRTVRG